MPITRCMEAPGSVRKQREEGGIMGRSFCCGVLRKTGKGEQGGFRIGWFEQRLQALGLGLSLVTWYLALGRIGRKEYGPHEHRAKWRKWWSMGSGLVGLYLTVSSWACVHCSSKNWQYGRDSLSLVTEAPDVRASGTQ